MKLTPFRGLDFTAQFDEFVRNFESRHQLLILLIEPVIRLALRLYGLGSGICLNRSSTTPAPSRRRKTGNA